MMLRSGNPKEAAIAVNRRGARTQDDMGARAAFVGFPYCPPKGNGATRAAMVSVSWADRSATSSANVRA
jgi:hypothetical protein